MKNKVLVEIVIPRLDERYNIFLPINKRIGNIVLLVNKAIEELSNGIYKCNKQASLYNSETGERYDTNKLLYETNIRNGSVLVLD